MVTADQSQDRRSGGQSQWLRHSRLTLKAPLLRCRTSSQIPFWYFCMPCPCLLPSIQNVALISFFRINLDHLKIPRNQNCAITKESFGFWGAVACDCHTPVPIISLGQTHRRTKTHFCIHFALLMGLGLENSRSSSTRKPP